MDRLTPQDPHRIGEYRLLGKLGEGGMGQVYLARSERGRTVAVKTIRSALAQEPDFRRRFAQEITAARRVGGRWTAPVLDADTEAATPWVATGYIAGPSLHEVVGRDYGPLPERSVSLLANGLAHALSDIHGAGLVHRDLKPSNVLMTIDGPRVIDFGIARALDPAPGENLTRTGATVGSPGFMSPEQVRGGRISPASDVFCLGSLLAYAATGRTPFGALDSGVHILMFNIAEERPDLTGVPEGLRELISGCLVKDPAQRLPVDEVLRATTPEAVSREPWLPGALVAQLGRHAIELLDSENPESRTDLPVVPPADATPSPTPSPAPAPGPHTDAGPASPAPAWPWSASPQPRPTPMPSPYSQPSGSYRPPPPSLPSSAGYPSSPWTTPPPSRGGLKRSTAILATTAVLVVMAVLGVLVATQLAGDSGGGDAIDDGYLGAWQGEYTSSGGDVHELRFEIEQGDEGDIVGRALTLAPETLCVYHIRLDAFDDRLDFTEESEWAAPPEQSDESCRDNATVQSLSLNAAGDALDWSYNDRGAELHRAPAASATNVPEALVGEWRDEWEDRDEDIEGEDIVTISQGRVGDVVLRFARSQDDEMTCTWENHLVATGDRQITLGPDQLVETGEDADCNVYPGFRVFQDEDDEDTLKINWLDRLDDDPAELERIE
ncbi:serine/threonine-protein kinase [Streptomyces radicis]|uniref:Serine/threonine protein kinase n=1 Tax=Streptomyces radicis TaxID=1750517 RepID=A0A3A9WUM1_9ACTN|nr:serine/threonine-protein kinase [Streptomyces radicis]RKN11506.1 serine/threonine protein kinase [Streptomyces radicis]RKN26475.1 serine/threonine protein kinase [Streptomyces radicis]